MMSLVCDAFMRVVKFTMGSVLLIENVFQSILIGKFRNCTPKSFTMLGNALL